MSERNYKLNEVTKKLVVAIIAIVLSLTSIVGATFALFTNNPDDGKIGVNVTSGRVKVDIVNEAQQSIVGDVLRFKNLHGNGEVEFEPGAVYLTQGFMVKNTGSLPINFRMYLSDDDSVNRAEFEKAFDFYITTDISKRDSDVKLTEFKDSLAVDGVTEVFYLVVKMKTTAGNEFQKKE